MYTVEIKKTCKHLLAEKGVKFHIPIDLKAKLAVREGEKAKNTKRKQTEFVSHMCLQWSLTYSIFSHQQEIEEIVC